MWGVLLLPVAAALDIYGARDILVQNPCAKEDFQTLLPKLRQAFAGLTEERSTRLAFQEVDEQAMIVWEECELELRMPPNLTTFSEDGYEQGVYELINSGCSGRASALLLLYERGREPHRQPTGRNNAAIVGQLGPVGMQLCRAFLLFLGH
jgi:hypothetical protein